MPKSGGGGGDSVSGVFKTKLGPLPMWQWLGLGAGAFLLWRMVHKPAAATPTPTASAQLTEPAQPTSAGAELQQSIGLLQQLQAFQSGQYQNALQQVGQTQGLTAQLNQLQTGASAKVIGGGPMVADPGDGTAAHPAGPITGIIPAGAVVTIVGNARPAWWSSGETRQYTAVPIQYVGAQGWINAINLQPLPYSVPGSGTTQYPPIGGPTKRRAPQVPIPGREGGPLWSPHHKALKANPRLQHYALGGPRDLATIAQQTGLHPARLMAANRHLDGHWNGKPPWVANPGEHIRIA